MKKYVPLMMIICVAILIICAGCEKDANYYLNAGNAKYMAKQFEEALEDLDKAIEMDPNIAEAYMKRGRCYQHLKKYDQALADYRKVISMEGDSEMSKRAQQLIEEISTLK